MIIVRGVKTGNDRINNVGGVSFTN